MLRVKGSFRNGKKTGARPNFHNFRSSGNGISWNDQMAVEVIEKAAVPEAKAVEVIAPPTKKKKGRPKKEK